MEKTVSQLTVLWEYTTRSYPQCLSITQFPLIS